MHSRLWVGEGSLAALIAFTVSYYILEPQSFSLRFANLLGWSALILTVVLMVQGFMKSNRNRKRIMQGLSKGNFREGFWRRMHEWGGIHIALSLLITVFILIHGAVFIRGLMQPSLILWFGAAAFTILLLSQLIGFITESRRMSRQFGTFKKNHLFLTSTVLVLSIVHVEGVTSLTSNPTLMEGALVAILGTALVWCIVPITVHGIKR
ncbi:MAG TPA: hypothetical protein VJZ75_04780 [Candidatus Bathyarchaeia archaeon]|nr:hypothetical protein [Candidatus Bathyarchaeia archaeon]